MKMNEYWKINRQIHAPAELSERVLTAARGRSREPVKRPVAWRAAVCACAALALILGAVGGVWQRGGTSDTAGETGPHAPVRSAWSFGLTAYAAERDETYGQSANATLSMVMDQPIIDAKGGFYSGCLFQITGEDVARVTLSIDKGEIYRWRMLENMTREEMGELRDRQARDEAAPTSIDMDDNGVWSAREIVRLGATVSEDYDPEAWYGIWVPVTGEPDTEQPDAEIRRNLEGLNDALLTVEVTSSGGERAQDTYRLSAGVLREVRQADGGVCVIPGITGDGAAEAVGFTAASETYSRYFSWPVKGANSVRLSAAYGAGAQADGAGEFIHRGIDIPADSGTEVRAALSGTVTETGFSPELGNYLVMDHGDGLVTVYGSCQTLRAARGDTVESGGLLGTVGSTGRSTGPHLHFEARQDGEDQDPLLYFDSAVRETLRAVD